jgi:hypothetical protein
MLINLKTNLKSLRFGNDVQGGGSSGLPYIKPGLPENSPAGEYLASIARASADWPLRGGTYSTVASTEDSVRISRFLTDFPKGSIFTAKQVGLQKSNPRIETGGRTSRLNTQTYNLNANLLAQVFEQGTGIHIPRAGSNANELGPDGLQNKYEYIVSHKESNNNRLVTLFNLKLNSNTDNIINSLDAATKLGIATNSDDILFDYEMGPDSLYGDGNTTIFKSTDFKGVSINTSTSFNKFKEGPFYNKIYTPGFNFFSKTDFEGVNSRYSSLTKYILNSKIPELSTDFNSIVIVGDPSRNTLIQQSSPSFIRPENNPDSDPYTYPGDIHYFSNTMAYSKLLSSKAISGPGYDLQDFRSKTDASALASTVGYTTGGPNGNGYNIESRIGVGSPGTRPNNLRNSFYDEYKDGQDKINMSPIYRRNIDQPVEDDDLSVRDLIKFCIESIDNGYPDETDRMHFRAYITNFSDNIGAEWNAQRYMGRGENFYTYQGFTREVGFTFVVAAQSVQEMEKIYQKVNYLASTLLPDYSGQGFMRGTIHKLTIGEYFYRTPGVITSMNISVEDNYPWEIKMSQPELRQQNNDNNLTGDQLQMEVPQILKIQMSFKPIMDKLPQKGLKEPIIISDKVANNYLSRKDFKFSE